MAYFPPTGSVVAFQSDPTKLVGTMSVMGNMSVLGTVPVTQSTSPWVVNVPSPSTIAYQLAGSVLAVSGSFSGGNSSVQVVGIMPPQSVSGVGLFNVNHTGNGSVVAIEYLVRNDTLASTLGVDGTIGPGTRTSDGRTVIKPFTADDTATFRYVGSVVSGSVTLIAPSVTGKRNYITDFAISNTGSVATLITFQDGSTSIIGFTIAPQTSGSNKNFAIPIRTNPSQDLAFKIGTMSSVVYATINGYTAP